MATLLTFPLETASMSAMLHRQADWLYLALFLMLFTSLAGVALRRHFRNPYVKPLVIALGSILTIATFSNRSHLSLMIDALGLFGIVLLICLAIVTPYALVRAFGLSKFRAFWLACVILYLLSWLLFPGFHQTMTREAGNFVNLVLFVLFLVALFGLFRPRPAHEQLAKSMVLKSPKRKSAESEAELNQREEKAFADNAAKVHKANNQTLNDISEILSSIIEIVIENPGGLSRQSSEAVSSRLLAITEKKQKLQKQLSLTEDTDRRAESADLKLLRQRLKRLSHSTGRSGRLIVAEVKDDKEKLELEQAISSLEKRLKRYLHEFDHAIRSAVEVLRRTGQPLSAKPYLERSRKILAEIAKDLQLIAEFEARLARLCKHETGLLEKEAQNG